MMTDWQEKFKKQDEDMRAAIKLLRAVDIELNVGSCGCCDSPWIKMKHQGVVVMDTDTIHMEMFKEEDDEAHS